MSALRVGFVGVGSMGGPMANRLLQAGYTVTVYDAVKALYRQGRVVTWEGCLVGVRFLSE